MDIRKMTDDEVLANMRGQTPLDKARRSLSGACARIEQAGSQRAPLAPIDLRRMEFEAVAEIAAALANVPGLLPEMTADGCASFLEKAVRESGPKEAAVLGEAARILRSMTSARAEESRAHA